MLNQATAHVPVDLPVRTRGVPNGKVVRPPFQMPIQLSNQCRDRLKALMTVRHLVQLLPLPLDRLRRRKHIQVPFSSQDQPGLSWRTDRQGGVALKQHNNTRSETYAALLPAFLKTSCTGSSLPQIRG